MFPHFMSILYDLSSRGINLNPLPTVSYMTHVSHCIKPRNNIYKKKRQRQNNPPPIDIKFPVSQFACEYLKKKKHSETLL